jgi:serine/threonine-protein kinase RsbW
MDYAEDRLSLRSNLSDMAQLPPWIGSLASRHGIPRSVEFAINLCLEEVVSNIILHGYGDDGEGSVIVSFTLQKQNLFIFVIEDDARHFDPLNGPPLDSQRPVRIGGQGIHFLREFADDLEYEVTATGNRLRIVFSATNSAP